MNCSDWEQEIAGESESEAVAEHLRGCAGCREFAGELEANRVALRSLEVHPAAFDAVRRRVLEEIRPKRRAAWWVALAAAAAACVAILSLLPLKNPAPPTVAPIQAKIVAQAVPPAKPHVVKRASTRPRHEQAKTEPIVIKMLTDDPNVIIIWLVDQKGDSL